MRYIELIAVPERLKKRGINVNLDEIIFPKGSHALRHYAANRWLSMGINLHDIKDLLNYKQLKTTINNYFHGLDFVYEEEFRKINRSYLDEIKVPLQTLSAHTGYSRRDTQTISKYIQNNKQKNTTLIANLPL